MPKHIHLTTVFAVSFFTLCLELLLTRVLAFVFWNHVVYLIISLALLGYGISSTFIVVSRNKLRQLPVNIFLSLNFILFISSTILSLLTLRYVNNLHGDIVRSLVMGSYGNLIIAAILLVISSFLFLLPFFSCGNILVYLFYIYPNFSNKLYSWDLIGATAGCLVFSPLISYYGAVVGILGILFLSLLFCMVLLHRCDNKDYLLWKIAYSLSLCSIIAVLTLFIFQSDFFHLTPDKTKSLGSALDKSKNSTIKHEYSSWDVVTRLDIVSNQKASLDIGWNKFTPLIKVITFDGDAISRIAPHAFNYPIDKDIKVFNERDIHVPFFEKLEGGDHLIIGLGGGLDIERSLLMRAKTITGVDINRGQSR